jgi:glucose-1-phosphate adenylyltransferase
MDLQREVVAIVLGGGRGTRLYPLTKVRAKPAVSLGGKYRLVDIPISNCLHSRIDRIYVLTQFQSGSLNRHIVRTYRFQSFGTGFIEVLAAQQGDEESKSGWYEGTADAVRRNLREFLELPAREYLILAGDQLYRMDFSDMIRTHREKGADITVAVTPVSREAAGAFGIMRLASDGRITEFVEKPKEPSVLDRLAVPGFSSGKTHLASMGIYLIGRDRLEPLVAPTEMQDFGKHVIPSVMQQHRVQAYIFDGYWEDIGTVAAYYREILALTDPTPRFDLFNTQKPIYTRTRYLPPTRLVGSVRVERSLLADGCLLRDCHVEHSVIGIRTRIGAGAQVRDSIILGADYYENPVNPGSEPGIGEGAVVRNAIVDKNVVIGKGARVLNERGVKEADGPGYNIRDGIVCIAKDTVIPEGAVI